MGFAQWFFIAIFGISLGVSLAKNGEPESPSNMFVTIPIAAIEIWVLYVANFFDKIAWPQITIGILMIAGVAMSITKHGKSNGNHNFFASAAAIGLIAWILNCGGFWG